MDIFGMSISTGTLFAWIGVELVIGFIIGFIVIPIALRWAIISAVVLGVLAYLGVVTVDLGLLKDKVKGSGLLGLIGLISIPLVVGIVIGYIVRKLF